MTTHQLIPKYDNVSCRCTTFAEVCCSAEANLKMHLGKGSAVNAEGCKNVFRGKKDLSCIYSINVVCLIIYNG